MNPKQQRNIPNEQFNSNHPSNKKPLSKPTKSPKKPTKPPPKLPNRTSPPNEKKRAKTPPPKLPNKNPPQNNQNNRINRLRGQFNRNPQQQNNQNNQIKTPPPINQINQNNRINRLRGQFNRNPQQQNNQINQIKTPPSINQNNQNNRINRLRGQFNRNPQQQNNQNNQIKTPPSINQINQNNSNHQNNQIHRIEEQPQNNEYSNEHFMIAKISTQKKPSFIKEGKEIYGLEINQSAVDHIRDNSSKDEISNVISFTGNTHSGKSTLINALLTSNKFNGKTGNVRISPNIGIKSSLAMSPTTGNLWVVDDPNNNYRYLDFEGNSASSKVPIDIDNETKKFLKKNQIKEQKYAIERRKSVEEHFPRLSYLVSNVIVFISTSDFADNKYYLKLLKNAKKSTQKVQSAEKPALILVKNKCSRKYETDYEKLTQIFFDAYAEDPEDPKLLRWYSEVHCFCLPNFDIEEPNSIEIFQKEIEIKRIN
ncbi:hypothetical protein M0811_13704 [Anaeramoeba ignava]|uniref:Uncharacterized protein n=1 Tax=Anaeramoeba ignava TaxID=1746090 RepID=A0A9Q0L5T4_ANAIG|nr:hypothetical protein M0811_13704 [Anaeramoeba ignava]